MLVDAARLLESPGERRIRFIISGDGDMRAHWQARAKGLKSVHFTGWIPHEELQAHFRSAHLGLILLKGGIAKFWLGNKIFEYMAAFLGLINDVQGEPRDIVESRALGINVDCGNSSSLANALGSLIDDPNRVRMFMECSKRAFMSEFDREAVEMNYVNYLGTLMNVNEGRQRGTSP
jgi:glycosyltransferase involved in cell wall biosynthesis